MLVCMASELIIIIKHTQRFRKQTICPFNTTELNILRKGMKITDDYAWKWGCMRSECMTIFPKAFFKIMEFSLSLFTYKHWLFLLTALCSIHSFSYIAEAFSSNIIMDLLAHSSRSELICSLFRINKKRYRYNLLSVYMLTYVHMNILLSLPSKAITRAMYNDKF